MKLNEVTVIVLDACVGASAGNTSLAPQSTKSRNILEYLIKNDSFKIVMCKRLFSEWSRHNSRYSSIWLSNMISKEKAILTDINDYSSVDNVIDTNKGTLRNNPTRITAAKKDSHLIHLASLHDKLIISNERNAAELFNKLFQNHEYGEIYWIYILYKNEDQYDSDKLINMQPTGELFDSWKIKNIRYS